MSADFIKMVSEIPSQRYVMQINNLIVNKIPCGLFYGLANPATAAENVRILKSNGFNITCLCVLDNAYQNGGGGGRSPCCDARRISLVSAKTAANAVHSNKV